MDAKGLIAVAVIIIIIILITFVIVPMFVNVNIFSFTPWAFPIVILAGVLIFFGYFFAKENPELAKCLFNGSVALVFFGILAIETAVFGAFVTKTQIPYQQCGSEEDPINLISCIMTGYKVSSKFMGWEWASFWLFFIILPFAFVFSLVWGFLSLVRLLPKPSTAVISVVLSAYAVRQVFGTFLLDLAAYGVWGVVGIFIPLLISFMLKRVFDIFLGPIEKAKKTLYGMIGAHLYASVEDINKKLERIEEALKSVIDKRTLESMKVEIESIKSTIEVLKKEVEENKALSTETKNTLSQLLIALAARSVADEKAIYEKIRGGGYW
jgi:soluble cytochrome b562